LTTIKLDMGEISLGFFRQILHSKIQIENKRWSFPLIKNI